MPTYNIKINEKAFHPPTDYGFPKLKSGNKLRPCQTYLFKTFLWFHYDEKYLFLVVFYLFLYIFL